MLQGTLRDIDIWWYWVNIGWYWLVFGGTGSVWGSTGCYLVILGQYNLVLFGIKWYWVKKGLLCLYILKKLMVTSTNQPTDRPTVFEKVPGGGAFSIQKNHFADFGPFNRAFWAWNWKQVQYDFFENEGGVKGPLDIFRKLIRFGDAICLERQTSFTRILTQFFVQ